MAEADASPRRAINSMRFSQLEQEVAALKASKGTLLARRVLATLGLTELPAPVLLGNAQVVKEPYLLLVYAEKEALLQNDLRPRHGAPPAISLGLQASLRAAYSTTRHPVNDWASTQIDRLVDLLLQVLRTYTLIAPYDEHGRSLVLEPIHVDLLMENARSPRDTARDLIHRLDSDFAHKNAGRAASLVFEGTRALDTKLFAPQDAWLAKKAAGKSQTSDKDFDDRRPDGGGRGGAGRGGRGRGRGGGFGPRDRKRDRERDPSETDE